MAKNILLSASCSSSFVAALASQLVINAHKESTMEYEQLDFDIEVTDANDPLTILLRQEAEEAGYDDVEAYLAS